MRQRVDRGEVDAEGRARCSASVRSLGVGGELRDLALDDALVDRRRRARVGREAGGHPLGIVGRRALRQEVEAAGVAVALDQALDQRRAGIGIGGELQPENDDAIEAGPEAGRARWRCARQADIDRGVEVEQPGKPRVRLEPAGRRVADEHRLELLRIGADEQIVGDRIAERLDDPCRR